MRNYNQIWYIACFVENQVVVAFGTPRVKIKVNATVSKIEKWFSVGNYSSEWDILIKLGIKQACMKTAGGISFWHPRVMIIVIETLKAALNIKAFHNMYLFIQ
jgi:hypothetical protein